MGPRELSLCRLAGGGPQASALPLPCLLASSSLPLPHRKGCCKSSAHVGLLAILGCRPRSRSIGSEQGLAPRCFLGWMYHQQLAGVCSLPTLVSTCPQRVCCFPSVYPLLGPHGSLAMLSLFPSPGIPPTFWLSESFSHGSPGAHFHLPLDLWGVVSGSLRQYLVCLAYRDYLLVCCMLYAGHAGLSPASVGLVSWAFHAGWPLKALPHIPWALLRFSSTCP